MYTTSTISAILVPITPMPHTSLLSALYVGQSETKKQKEGIRYVLYVEFVVALLDACLIDYRLVPMNVHASVQ
jgi:hypothetical protein